MAEVSVIDFALYYARRGMQVFPVDTHKHPLVKWADEATRDEERIKAWWEKQFPGAGVGIATGARSGIVVLDIDVGKGGPESLMRLLVDWGQLPNTPETITGGGGRHIIFRHPGVDVRNSASKLGPGLDIRGDGGYIVAPPSMHESGNKYRWEPGARLSQTELAEMPGWLVRLLVEPQNADGKPQHMPAQEIPDTIPNGARNQTLTSLAGTMRRRGMSNESIYLALCAENSRRCNPPLPDLEIRQIANSVGRYIPSAPAVFSGKPEVEPRDPQDAFVVGTAFMDLLENLDGRSINTGLVSIDSALGGFERQNLIVLAARPSMGKTTFAWQIARQIAAGHLKIIFFSLEMSAAALWAKSVCGALGIRWRDVRSGNATEAQLSAIYEETGRQMNLYGEYLLVDDGVNTTETIWSTVEKHRPDIFFVDHLRLLADSGDREDKRLGVITQRGKETAKAFNASAVYLAQLNRGVENRENKRPTLADLRDSGQIEENADLVLMLHNEEYYEPTGAQKPLTEVLVRKFRDDVLNQRVSLGFDLQHQRFEDVKVERIRL